MKTQQKNLPSFNWYGYLEKKKPKPSFVCSYIFLLQRNATDVFRWYWGQETWVEDQCAKATIAP